jgi:hypothetical protein
MVGLRFAQWSRLISLGALGTAMACGGTERSDANGGEGEFVVAKAPAPTRVPDFVWLGYVPASSDAGDTRRKAEVIISDGAGNHPPMGSVNFQTCVGGRGRNAPHLTLQQCADQGGNWVPMGGGISYDPSSGLGTSVYGTGVLSLRCTVSGRGTGWSSGSSSIDVSTLLPIPP